MDALKQDKQVKINGLGTFRLQAIAARKSVNVTTGEEITIPGYNKVAFAPEAGLKELVEKGGGAPEAIDPIKKLGAVQKRRRKGKSLPRPSQKGRRKKSPSRL